MSRYEKLKREWLEWTVVRWTMLVGIVVADSATLVFFLLLCALARLLQWVTGRQLRRLEGEP